MENMKFLWTIPKIHKFIANMFGFVPIPDNIQSHKLRFFVTIGENELHEIFISRLSKIQFPGRTQGYFECSGYAAFTVKL